MQQYLSFLQWIDHQKEHMVSLVESWSNINSHSMHGQGLSAQLNALKKSFETLGGDIEEIDLVPFIHINEQGKQESFTTGKALHITKRKKAPIQIFFGGHMDTVYPKTSAFQKITRVDEKTIKGPGVCDMKAGLSIMLTALQAFEKSPYAENVGWEIVINPDEEIGSPSSKELLESCAKRNHLGLIFEPAFSDGALVSERGGSTNLTVVVTGKSAHSGRDFSSGKSAIFALAPLLVELEKLNEKESQENPDVIVNVGQVLSGHAYNIVPDLAICRINLRGRTTEKMSDTKKKIEELVKKYGQKEGISMKVLEQTERLPKPMTAETDALFQWLKNCGDLLDIQFDSRASRGVSDGNILHQAGLATIDTLGAVGGNIHTHNEYILIDSLPERAKLVALLLMKIGNSEFLIPKKSAKTAAIAL